MFRVAVWVGVQEPSRDRQLDEEESQRRDPPAGPPALRVPGDPRQEVAEGAADRVGKKITKRGVATRNHQELEQFYRGGCQRQYRYGADQREPGPAEQGSERKEKEEILEEVGAACRSTDNATQRGEVASMRGRGECQGAYPEQGQGGGQVLGPACRRSLRQDDNRQSQVSNYRTVRV